MIIRTQMEMLYPETAKKLLSKNSVNRPIHWNQVSKIKQDIISGRFQSTHQGILIGKDGCLLDGQHRCLAVVESGMPILIMISYDDTLTSPLDLQVDGSVKRSINWKMGIPKRNSEVSRMMISLVNNTYDGTNCKPKGDTSDIDFLKMSRLIEPEHSILTTTTRTCFSSAPVRTAAILSMNSDNMNSVAEQYKQMVTYEQRNLWPIMVSFVKELSRRLETIPGGGLGQSDLMARAYKAFTADKTLVQLRLGTKGTPTKEDIMKQLDKASSVAKLKYGHYRDIKIDFCNNYEK